MYEYVSCNETSTLYKTKKIREQLYFKIFLELKHKTSLKFKSSCICRHFVNIYMYTEKQIGHANQASDQSEQVPQQNVNQFPHI